MSKLNGYHSIDYRNLCILKRMVNDELTLREAAEVFHLSKSTIHDIVKNYIKQWPHDSLTVELKVLMKDNYDRRIMALNRMV